MSNSSKIPLGLRLIQAISVLSIILFMIIIVSTFVYHKINYFTFVGSTTTLSILSSLAFSVFVIYCISHPSHLFYKILITILGISILLSLSKLVTSNFPSPSLYTLSILLNLSILWYLSKVKTYFTTGQIDIEDTTVKRADRFFKIFVILWFIAIFLLPLILGGIMATRSTNSILLGLEREQVFAKNFEGKTFDQNIDYCKSLPSQSDECIIILIIHNVSIKETVDIKTCSLLSTNKTKYACYAVLQRCDLLNTGENNKKLCKIDSLEYQRIFQGNKTK